MGDHTRPHRPEEDPPYKSSRNLVRNSSSPSDFSLIKLMFRPGFPYSDITWHIGQRFVTRCLNVEPYDLPQLIHLFTIAILLPVPFSENNHDATNFPYV